MVDWMATAQNARCPCFNSHFHEEGSEVVDALCQDWRQENNWVTPPIALILKIITLIHQQCASATIVVLTWLNRLWFHELLELCIEPPIPIPNNPLSFKLKGKALPEPLHNQAWQWIACRISAMLNSTLAPSTWKHYQSSLQCFHEFCKWEETSFPPEQEEAVVVIANFLKTKWPVNHGRTFNLSSLAALFHDWGPWTTPSKTRAKLIALLCMLGAL
ncbi:uncharacterized protein ACA1_195710 [Acanthamoeba castellanii str. Neff]|uniref:Core-binding (CB) domain-containing protein n=1 Tax=Acanthamoeba castellanii (strain ATCC 30010 / Neff) TaxID=1257118 RepID=L8HDZ0_ACACF|nr:uncharacterized protein ACA1_195710 [Acanthamoeba castellanii str. Neff]ELR23749.1 hypothetical protein ACA1_195710 [Acanthamoeba castellanii str. Neff]